MYLYFFYIYIIFVSICKTLNMTNYDSSGSIETTVHWLSQDLTQATQTNCTALTVPHSVSSEGQCTKGKHEIDPPVTSLHTVCNFVCFIKLKLILAENICCMLQKK